MTEPKFSTAVGLAIIFTSASKPATRDKEMNKESPKQYIFVGIIACSTAGRSVLIVIDLHNKDEKLNKLESQAEKTKKFHCQIQNKKIPL